MYNLHAINSVTFVNCTFITNHARASGGAMYTVPGDLLGFANCEFTGNTADGRGGGIFVWTGSPTINNCTFAENAAMNGAALACLGDPRFPGTVQIANCILWGGRDEIWHDQNMIIRITFTDITGGWPGDGNIDADPLFVDPANGDYRLATGSPCIDAADNTAVPPGITTDLDGNPRFWDDRRTPDTGNPDGIHPIVDMGPYEFGSEGCPDDDGDGFVTVCHIPPGRPGPARTITVPVWAVAAHLAHGDYCGSCNSVGESEKVASGRGNLPWGP